MKKSYHSNAVPAAAALTTNAIEPSLFAGVPAATVVTKRLPLFFWSSVLPTYRKARRWTSCLRNHGDAIRGRGVRLSGNESLGLRPAALASLRGPVPRPPRLGPSDSAQRRRGGSGGGPKVQADRGHIAQHSALRCRTGGQPVLFSATPSAL